MHGLSTIRYLNRTEVLRCQVARMDKLIARAKRKGNLDLAAKWTERKREYRAQIDGALGNW